MSDDNKTIALLALLLIIEMDHSDSLNEKDIRTGNIEYMMRSDGSQEIHVLEKDPVCPGGAFQIMAHIIRKETDPDGTIRVVIRVLAYRRKRQLKFDYMLPIRNISITKDIIEAEKREQAA